jgi:hypothetical protein
MNAQNSCACIDGDMDDDGKSDLIVWRSGNGIWYALPSKSPGSYTCTLWGLESDIIVAGDYDGDGKSDIAVWRPGNGIWYVRPSGTKGTYPAYGWGISGVKSCLFCSEYYEYSFRTHLILIVKFPD